MLQGQGVGFRVQDGVGFSVQGRRFRVYPDI